MQEGRAAGSPPGMKVAGWSSRLGPVEVDIVLARSGHDLTVCLAGGRAHIGSSALAVPRPSLAHAPEKGATASVLAVPGHKDDEVARPLALTLAARLNAAVCVTCGIHVPHLSRGAVDEILKDVERLAGEIVGRLDRESDLAQDHGQ